MKKERTADKRRYTQMKSIRIAVLTDDCSQVASMLGEFLSIPLVQRDSSYFGDCWTSSTDLIRVLENFDPMYLPSEDPPEDRYFEADFAQHGTLVDLDDVDNMTADRVLQFLRERFRNCEIVRVNEG